MAPAATMKPVPVNAVNGKMANGYTPKPVKTTTAGLRSLQSAEEKRLYEIVDKLQKLDVDHELNLPQLIVCGSQSSGKSSVLEAISELPFPRGERTCTRMATMIQYRRDANEHLEVTILPDKTKRSPDEQARLNRESFATTDLNQLPNMIEQAERCLGIRNEGFARDVLKVRITGPDYQPLTLVDLPGLIQFHDKDTDYIDFVNAITDDWIRQKRSIILAVVEADQDLEKQGILTHAKKADPSGERTFGIITKPDLPDRGGELESYWISRAQNLPDAGGMEGFNFKKGWHVLRNAKLSERGSEFSSRNALEAQFFEDRTSNWHIIDPRYRGIGSLRQRLSTLLFEHTKKQLPEVLRDLEAKLEECTDELRGLETRLQRPEELWVDFQDKQKELAVRVSRGVDGSFTDAMYHDWEQTPSVFLRSRIEEQHDAFYDDIMVNGHTLPVPRTDGTSSVEEVGAYIEEVKRYLNMTRGDHLPGYTHTQRMTSLFVRYSSRWRAVAQIYVDRAYNHCQLFIDHVIKADFQKRIPGLPTSICQKMVYFLSRRLKDRRNLAMRELDKLEEDRNRTIKTRNKAFEGRSRQRKDDQSFALTNQILHFDDNLSTNPEERTLEVQPGYHRRASGQDEASLQAEDVGMDMLIYYDIARDTFVDNVLVQVIERHLLAPLYTLFHSDFDIKHADFLTMLNDEDYHRIENQKRHLEEHIARLSDCRRELI